jgi:His/Glu/Gln/Arg/opine family amino acid ABC transporter permease subunit
MGDLILRSLPLLTKGAWLTLQLWFASALLSLCLGILLGVLTCSRLRSPLAALLLDSATFILRAIPFYVQLLIFYFVLPDLIQIHLEAFTASILALGVCSSAYTAQVVRCGINSIPIEQWESALTLGYSKVACVRYIIMPQMFRNILPALTNELDALLKSTAILSSIGLLELTRMGMNIVSREMEPLVIYLSVAAFYVAISGALYAISKTVERRFQYANR